MDKEYYNEQMRRHGEAYKLLSQRVEAEKIAYRSHVMKVVAGSIACAAAVGILCGLIGFLFYRVE
jgi:hypothetical protein